MPDVSASDAQLWGSWCAGDKQAGRALFDRYFAVIARFFANKVGPEADDLVQDTFATFFAASERVREPERLRSYLFGVAYNLLRAHYRRRHGLAEVELDSRSIHDLAPGPSTALRGDEQQQLLGEALIRIPLELQIVVELSYWEELDSFEIGRALALPAATVRTRLRRARQLLAAQLESLPGSPATRARVDDALDAWAARVLAQVDE
ncbi:RNA polymerase sigma factor [Nannocystaceae bacterium ST9]